MAKGALGRYVGVAMFLLLPAFAAQGQYATPAMHGMTVAARPPVSDAHLDSLIAQLSLAEKLELLGGVDGMYTRAVPRIGLRRLKMSDGPLGVASWGPSTAYAGGVMLAATWDPALAERLGASIGRDARARGVDLLLGPGVNIARQPQNGRNFEYFGEDPWLASRLTVGYVTGVQRQGVLATIKHYAANNVETDRHDVDVVVDERTLRELYLPAFEAAVHEAHVGAVMDSYNRINGEHATQHSHLNLDILKREWGFDGLLMSDWRATYDGVAAAKGGLDLEMPSALVMKADTLQPAVERGTVSLAAIDDKVRRLLRTAERVGALRREASTPSVTPLDDASARQVALDVAREGIVLLKNRGDVLPLTAARVKTIAVIGPNAWPAVPTGGGSAQFTPFRATSFLEGIGAAAGSQVRVLYTKGLPDPLDVMQGTRFDPIDGSATGRRGLRMQRFDNTDWTGTPVAVADVRVADQWVGEQWSRRRAPSTSIRWEGKYTPQVSGAYLVLAGAGDDDSYTLYVDDRPVIVQPKHDGQALADTVLQLTAGETIHLRLDYVQRSDRVRAGFGIIPVDSLVTEEAKRIAAHADAVVVCAGFNGDYESEGFDRTFGLPWGQDVLIKSIAAVNSRTIISLTAGGGVDMAPWIDAVPAVLHTWYAGQEGGTALGEILFGIRAPEGKLPVTLDRAWSDNPVHAHDVPVWDSTAGMPRLVYAESLMVGYRYYTTAHRAPLFPFGFGLSYTTFAMTQLHAPSRVSAQALAQHGLDVQVDVANTGRRAGAEVVQLYVGAPSTHVTRPAKELKAFQKVRLQSGERRRVTLHLTDRSFAYYDVSTHAWRVEPGRYTLFMGNASDKTPLDVKVDVTE